MYSHASTGRSYYAEHRLGLDCEGLLAGDGHSTRKLSKQFEEKPLGYLQRLVAQVRKYACMRATPESFLRLLNARKNVD